MSPKCPNCGWEPTKGRPRKLDDAKVRKLREQGKSLAEIAKKFGVTRGAVQAALNRHLAGSERFYD
jgi:transposase